MAKSAIHKLLTEVLYGMGMGMLFHLVQRISLHLKSPDLYLFCTTKVFPKFLLPFEASFQSDDFGSSDYMHHVAVTGHVLFIKS